VERRSSQEHENKLIRSNARARAHAYCGNARKGILIKNERNRISLLNGARVRVVIRISQ
jgi:hypothetical protein